MKTITRISRPFHGVAQGFRSGFEERIKEELRLKGIEAGYETLRLPFLQPALKRHYTPDFILPNGILIETKGRFTVQDRQKHKYIKASHPELDIRFIFQNPKAKISKSSPTSYAKWCEKEGFLYAAKSIPEAWLNEPPCEQVLRVINQIAKFKNR